MKRFKTFALIGALIAGLFIGNTPPQMADAACGSIPYFFTNGTSIVDATTTNANNAFLIGCATSVDNSQIGVAGIYPSQITATSVFNGTFGGGTATAPYKFALATGTQVPLTIQAATTPSTDLFDVFNNALTIKLFSIPLAGGSYFSSYNNTLQSGIDGGGSSTLMRFMTNGFAAATVDGAGHFNFMGPIFSAALSNSTTLVSSVAPTYNSSGTATASTLHTTVGSCSMAAAATCTIAFSGAAVFANQTYSCSVSTNGNTPAIVQDTTTNSVTVEATAVATASYYVNCIGP